MRRLLLLCALTVGCPKASSRPGRVEVLVRDADGAPRVGRRQHAASPCAWELVVVEGRGWATWARTPGPAQVLGGPGGEMVAWSSCGSDGTTWLVIGDSPDLHDRVPFPVESVEWLDERTVHITGGGSSPSGVRWGRHDHDWVVVPQACVPLHITPTGEPELSGQRVTLLLLADLDGDARDEWVVEVPDSCGTARCSAAVYTPCQGDGLARPVGRIDHMDGVEALEATTGTWRQLRSRHGEGTDVWAMLDGEYRLVPAPSPTDAPAQP